MTEIGMTYERESVVDEKNVQIRLGAKKDDTKITNMEILLGNEESSPDHLSSENNNHQNENNWQIMEDDNTGDSFESKMNDESSQMEVGGEEYEKGKKYFKENYKNRLKKNKAKLKRFTRAERLERQRLKRLRIEKRKNKQNLKSQNNKGMKNKGNKKIKRPRRNKYVQITQQE
eukprot:TRINITY_DN48122_c0_g2_i1.p1 TRINITY_DN48122_c0_g2~~TRINITY_DN48122_c0_g2_i1.p1  ORF type:complete len:174 (+),score=26.80 TRINITY_DN48122_c0_g2_i1:83-604(+)